MEGIDLEQVPPRKGTDSLYSDRPRAAREGSSGMQIQGTSARWTGSGEATAQGCRELLATQSVDAVVVGVGQTVCVVNDHSPIAALKVTGTRYKEGSYGLIEGQLTVWDLRADGS
ncbi:hypothetical protein ACIRBX_02600 [Kitasatospora sp. NPDC096147]|uniref:hypothetical protein n=1 Tax=Kitasatospora sp. NPDC096147 TaxID=3364093 RepID=UPI003827F90E